MSLVYVSEINAGTGAHKHRKKTCKDEGKRMSEKRVFHRAHFSRFSPYPTHRTGHSSHSCQCMETERAIHLHNAARTIDAYKNHRKDSPQSKG
mmetsp:Transcript_134708/g.200472  ORF Transcript_134708/g.200472 Transcript_134708/m.200472 type:complete len:93 (-) Transcript_134708:225-503(-)